MDIKKLKNKIPKNIFSYLEKKGISELRPCQHKAISKGLFDCKNLLICTPTASGKTLVAEMALIDAIQDRKMKGVYIVPLKALANEKYKEFKEFYGKELNVALSIGDTDSSEPHLAKYDLIVTTSEKLDSLIRHHSPWIKQIGCMVVDEIHLLNDPGRGPTLEILITLLRQMLQNVQIVGLSATIGNPEELASWLEASLVIDNWRPVKLHKGVYSDGEIEFFD